MSPVEGNVEAVPPASEQPSLAKSELQAAIDRWIPRLRAIRDAWQAALPPEASTTWDLALIYVRESYGTSLVGEAPDTQIRGILNQCIQKRLYVPADGVYFDVRSATDTATRGDYQRLFERALTGGYRAIVVYINERMFRNVEQSKAAKRQLRRHGIEFIYTGMYEGDQRSPSAWLFDTMQDTQGEYHARNTSNYVGRQFEVMSRAGRPVGHLPEVFREKTRAPGIFGRRGSVIEWEVVEPLATIIKEACRRYLAGDSFSDLATWARTTELKGVSPKNRIMDAAWWFNTLRNPKLAGYQRPTEYMGYKPGVESPRRPAMTRGSELVPCLLPALWPIETYREILRIGAERSHGPKRRRTYTACLLSSIAVSAECGHSMRIGQRHQNGHFSMKCGISTLEHPRLPERRADIAERELDELAGMIRIEDEGLHRQIEEELQELARNEAVQRDAFRANPAIAAVRQALVALGSTSMSDVRTELEKRLLELEEQDADRRDRLSEPLVDYRKALKQLKEWTDVWRDADTWAKNELLRKAGVRVVLGVRPEDSAKSALHVLSVSAENPAFSLALGAVFAQHTVSDSPDTDPMSAIRIVFPNAHMGLASVKGAGLSAGIVHVRRPLVVVPDGRARRPNPPGGPWLTLDEAGTIVGLAPETLLHHIRRGRIETERFRASGHRWWMIRADELERFAARRARLRQAA